MKRIPNKEEKILQYNYLLLFIGRKKLFFPIENLSIFQIVISIYETRFRF